MIANIITIDNINQFINFELIKIGEHSLQVYNILSIIIVFIITKLIVWIFKKLIQRKKAFKEDPSNAYALIQITSYIIWVIAILIMFESVGISVDFLIASSAALMVGIGLGLQQTFNDFISGLILLFEGSTKIGDILDIDGDIVKIKEIGLRTSKAMNRHDIAVIIPNSLITTSKVINLSHQTKNTLFSIEIGVAYGSDIELVKETLIEAAIEHPRVIKKNKPIVRFVNFGASSLDFKLLFYSKEIFIAEQIKSDIRFNIDRLFREKNINIPFPQMDVYLKK